MRYLLLAIFSVFAFSVATLSFALEEKESSAGVQAIEQAVKDYGEILRNLAKEALYPYTEEEIRKLHECMIMKSFATFDFAFPEKPKKEIPGIVFQVPNCFPNDPYANFLYLPDPYSENTDTKSFGQRARLRAHRLTPSVGYLKISSFPEEIVEREIIPLLRKFNASRISKVVLDLRGNDGGYVAEAVELMRLFTENGAVIFEERHRTRSKIYQAHKRGAYADLRLAVLVDNNTLSAGEVVAGVLQHWGAKVFGETPTYGKGTVQGLLPLANGWLKFTTARIFLPNGKTYDESGIVPDFLVEPSSKDAVRDKAVEYLNSK